MAETPTTSSSIPNEIDSSIVAQGDSSAVDVQVMTGAQSEELADSVDALLLFLPEHLDSSTDVLPSQPPAYVVTICTSLPASESSSPAEPLSLQMSSPSTLNVTSGQQSEGEMVGRLCDLEAQLVGLQTLHRLCTDIEGRLGRTEDALHDLHDVAVTTSLQRACMGFESRLARTEDALQQVVEHTVELRTQIDTRFARIEDVLRRVHETVVERSRSKQLWASIDERPTQTEADRHPFDDHNAASTWTIGVQRVVVFSADLGRRARPVLHHAAAATAAIALAARQDLARTLLSAQRLTATLATTTGADVARLQQAVRRCGPAIVLAAVMAVAAIVRNDPRIDTTSAAAVVEAKTVPPSATRTSVTASTANAPMGALQFLGSLAIASEPPGATVFVDGQRVGVTPLELPASKAGSLALQITRKGFQRWTAAIQVPAGQLTQVTVTLQPTAP